LLVVEEGEGEGEKDEWQNQESAVNWSWWFLNQTE